MGIIIVRYVFDDNKHIKKGRRDIVFPFLSFSGATFFGVNIAKVSVISETMMVSNEMLYNQDIRTKYLPINTCLFFDLDFHRNLI